MNNKGFTLVELIATLLILALVMSIATYSITNIIRKSKEENYNLLIKNIRDGAEEYYQECKYSRETIYNMFNNDESDVNNFCDGSITLGELVTYGYIKGNSSENGNALVNPNNDENISNCQLKVYYNNGNVSVEAVSSSVNDSCPSEY